MVRSQRRCVRALLPLGALSAVLTLFVAGSAGLALTQTVRTGTELAEVSRAQRLHQDADSMRDVLRADVVLSQQVGRSRPAAATAQLQRATDAHAAQFRRDLELLRAVAVPAEVRSAVESVRRPGEAFVALAVHVVRVALPGERDAVAETRFRRAFGELVGRQVTLTSSLAVAAARAERQERQERTISTVLVIALAVAVAGWVVVVVMLRRTSSRLLQALRREAAERAVADELRRPCYPCTFRTSPDFGSRPGPGPSTRRRGFVVTGTT